MTDPVAVIEAAYRADVDERAWLSGIVAAACPLIDAGYGVMSFTYDTAEADGGAMGTLVGKRIPLPGWQPLFRYYSKRTARSERDPVFFSGPPCATLSETIGANFLRTNPLARKVKLVGIHDLLVVHGNALARRGCALAVPLGQAGPASAAAVATWSRVAAHLAAGLRLRAKLAASGDALAAAEVILDPQGHVQHASGLGTSREARAAIRGAAVAIDRARGAMRRTSQDEALALWQGLVDGRWTIVDHFDRDGRRYIVAQPNDPAVPRRATLSRREAQVLGYAALGHPNKYIAYELGLAESTVATHISHAAKKLGAGSRAELLRLFHDLPPEAPGADA